MSPTLLELHDSLQLLLKGGKQRISYSELMPVLYSNNDIEPAITLVEKCDQLLKDGIVIDKVGRTVTLFNSFRIQSTSNPDRPINIQIENHSEWIDSPCQKETLSMLSILFNRTSQNYTMADSNLKRLIVNIAVNEFIELKKLSQSIEQRPLINEIVKAISLLWSDKHKEICHDIHKQIIETSNSIKKSLLSVLDQDLVDLLSVLPEPSTMVQFYELYQKFYPHKEALLKWQAESKQKLIYVLLNTEQGLLIDGDNYFSYSNLLDANAHRTFLDKVSVRRVFKSDLSILNQLLSCTTTNYSNYSGFFSLWTYWLGHTSHESINPNVFSVISKFGLHEYFEKSNKQHLKTFLKHGVPLFDVLYEFLLELLNSYQSFGENPQTFIDSITFNENEDYFSDALLPSALQQKRIKVNTILNEISDFILFVDPTVHDGCLPLSNLNRINTTTNIHSLTRNAHIWHDEVQCRGKGPLCIWSQFKPFSAHIQGCTFTLLTDNHQLFYEGLEMKHCVNTFENRIKENSYIVFSIKSPKEDGTLGLTLNTDGIGNAYLSIHQIKGHYNCPLSSKVHAAAKELAVLINAKPELIYIEGDFPSIDSQLQNQSMDI